MVWRRKLGETYGREKEKSMMKNHTARPANPRKVSGLRDDLDDHISTIRQPLRTLRKHERRIFKYDNSPR